MRHFSSKQSEQHFRSAEDAANSIASSMGIQKSMINKVIEESGLQSNIRPEQLSMEPVYYIF